MALSRRFHCFTHADPSHPRGLRTVGDGKIEKVSRKAAIAPLPGGVGPMTITKLLYDSLQSGRSAAGR